MKYVVIGFPKCAQVSLVQYLKDKGLEAEKFDMIWQANALELIKHKYKNQDCKFIIVIRNVVDRIWSGFIFWRYYQTMTIKEYTHHYRISRTLGDENPIIQSDYTHWLDHVKELDPLLADFDELVKTPDFPHENKTKFEAKMSREARDYLENDVVLKLFQENFKKYLDKNNFKRLKLPIA